MTKLLVIGLGILAILIVVFQKSPGQELTQTPSPSPSPQPSVRSAPEHQLDYQINDKTFRANWFMAPDATQVFLYSNLVNKQTSTEFIDDKKCKSAVSAGFYTKENTPVGLFITEGKEIAPYVPNTLFNGIIATTNRGFQILTSPPDNARWALQTGPWLVRNEQPLKLRIQNDEYARRMVAAITTNNTLLYIAFYDPENIYEGPLLGELPIHIKEFQKQTGISINDALNLDGGNASAFITSEVNLGELVPVGSFFCVR